MVSPARPLARRSSAQAVSSMGTPRMTSGRNSGAKKKNVWPRTSASVLPPMAMVAAAISTPRLSAPASPMNSLAGWKFHGR